MQTIKTFEPMTVKQAKAIADAAWVKVIDAAQSRCGSGDAASLRGFREAEAKENRKAGWGNASDWSKASVIDNLLGGAWGAELKDLWGNRDALILAAALGARYPDAFRALDIDRTEIQRARRVLIGLRDLGEGVPQ